MTTKQQKEIKEFAKKVAPVYKLLKWKWWNGIPNAQRIEVTILELLKSIENNEGNCETSTGGLFAKKEKDEDFGITTTYGFKVEEYFYEI